MPVHDWTRVDAGLYHDFHHGWISALTNALNARVLPSNCYALIERDHLKKPENVPLPEPRVYSLLANRVAIRSTQHRLIAVIEVLSPGSKSKISQISDFVEKSLALIQRRINLLVIDLFPPGKHDPYGIHHAIWNKFEHQGAELPGDKALTLVSYCAGPPPEAYLDKIGIGDAIPEMPLFLDNDHHFLVPLEATYQATWEMFPNVLKGLLQNQDRN